MSPAEANFERGIQDADQLLVYFDAQPKPPSDGAEVLKRAALIMALTAWETYVEDRVTEEVQRIAAAGGFAQRFLASRFEEELKRFHNPSSDKTRRLFFDYVGIDVTEHWAWQQFDAAGACERLNDLIKKRGDAVHRARPVLNGLPAKHLIRRDELATALRFLRHLVAKTEAALASRAGAAEEHAKL